MPSRVLHVNKTTGVIYVYESTSYWDKIKKQPRSKQICIGKLDPISGKFIPSKRLNPIQAAVRDPAVTATAEIIGPAILLDPITEQLGLKELLKSCFPNFYQQILIMAYYLVSYGGPLCHCSTWCKSHAPLFEDCLTSQRISEILNSISIDGKQTFFNKWIKKTAEKDHLCYDITSISSYSELNEYIKYGYNRDKEDLPQLNLAMFYGQKSCLPVYFHRLPGNISDVSTLCNLTKTFKALEISYLEFVMDKGFYSKKNINDLLVTKNKFIISIPLNNKWLQQAIDKVYDTIQGPEAYRKTDDQIVYVETSIYPWGEKNHRCYLHVYYNPHTRAEAQDSFNHKLWQYKEELESGQLIKDHQEAYKTFFVVQTTPKRGRKIFYNTEVIKQYIKRYTGFYAILTNAIKDPIEALQIYRNKDVVEKSFDDIKNQLDMKRLRVHKSPAADGRLFIEFIALVYFSALRKEMRRTGLIERYTVREMLHEMEPITKIKYAGKHRQIITELSKLQKEILEKLEIKLPIST